MTYSTGSMSWRAMASFAYCEMLAGEVVDVVFSFGEVGERYYI